MGKVHFTVAIPKKKGHHLIVPSSTMDKPEQNAKFSASERSPCPDCGSKHVISHGNEWRCKECRRWFQKYPRQPKLIPAPERCVWCGQRGFITSASERWVCKAPFCKRTWGKHLHEKYLAKEMWKDQGRR
jgi:ribosomal protein S27AE